MISVLEISKIKFGVRGRDHTRRTLFKWTILCIRKSRTCFLKSVWDMGCSDVVLESDLAVAVHLLNKAVDALHPLATLLWGY